MTTNLKANTEERLILVDGHAILHRAFHALPPLTTRNGELVNAVYGFATMLLKILADFKPKYIAVAFDTPKPNFRHQEFVGYQAQRKKTDEELVGQIQRVQELVQAFNIPIFKVEGFEADDVIGTLARQAVEKDKAQAPIEVIIVTGDRDLMQLVNRQVKLFMPTRGLSEGQIIGESEVKEKMGVTASQIIDYKALVGDQSDNYPGVPGIGPKTATDLLAQFETLNGVYSHLDQIEKTRTASKLKEGEESAQLSKMLATIRQDVPIELKLEDCLAKDYDEEVLRGFFKEMGFRSLMARISKEPEKKEEGEKEKAQQSLF